MSKSKSEEDNITDTFSYTVARNTLAKLMKKVCSNHAPIRIIRQNAESVVMMSLEDFQSYEETAYLLRSPASRKRIEESLDQINKGKVVKVPFSKLDKMASSWK